MTSAGAVRQVDSEEAQRLVESGTVRVVDVRTPEEYAGLGHIPGALLLPVGLIASAPAEKSCSSQKSKSTTVVFSS